MKRFKYFKLNFNMTKNETMIAMMLTFIAPLIASLGERESIRSFLMGTDGPSIIQIMAGGSLLVIATGVLVKGIIKIAYDSFVSESAQIYSSLPVSFAEIAVIKITVLSLNMLIVLLGFAFGITMAWIFGNNELIDSVFDTIVSLATSGIATRIALIPLGVVAMVVFVFFINELIFGGFSLFASPTKKPKGSAGKVKVLLSVVIYTGILAWLLIKSCDKLLVYVAVNYIDSLWIAILALTAVFAAVALIGVGMCVYKLKNEYYL